MKSSDKKGIAPGDTRVLKSAADGDDWQNECGSFPFSTHWTYTGKQMNGIRLVQIHPKVAEAAWYKNGDAIAVESPRGSIKGTALIWEGIRGYKSSFPTLSDLSRKWPKNSELPTMKQLTSCDDIMTTFPVSKPTNALLVV